MEKDESILSLADRIMDVLRDRKNIELNDLAKCVEANPEDVKRIVGLLERESLAKVEHKLTKIQVFWTGDIFGSETAHTPSGRSMIDISRDAAPGRNGKTGGVHLPRVPEKAYYISEPAIKLTDYESKNGGDAKGIVKSAPSVSLRPLNVFIPEYARPEHQRAEPAKQQNPEPKPGAPKPELQKTDYQKSNQNYQKIDQKIESAKPILTAPKRLATENDGKVGGIGGDGRGRNEGRNEAGSVRTEVVDETPALASELQGTLGRIQTDRQELSELNAQEAGFLDERYKPLSKKMEMEIGAITETILEKERQIEQQKMRAKALMEAVSGVEVESIRIHDEELKARKEFEGAMLSLEKLLDRLREIRKGIGYEVRVSKRMLAEQMNELKNLNASIDSLVENEKEVDRKIKLARSRIEEEEKGLDSIKTAASGMRRTRETIRNRVNEINEIFGPERMKEIEDTLSGISHLESKLEACRQEYLKEIAELKRNSRESAEAVENLRESIHANFVRKTAAELDRAGKDYEDRMSSAFEDEKKLTRRAEDAKARLRGDIEHAKELSRRLKELAPPGKDITDARMMQELKELERIDEEEKRSVAGAVEKEGKGSEKRVKIIDDIKGLFSKFKERIEGFGKNDGEKKIAGAG